MSTQEQTFGFTSFAETLSGRLAMVGFSLALVTEVLTGKGIVGQLASLLGG
ncbi:high light inducible protein [Acaryochloris marina NIES-2412]|uniref:high light inducible protein n=1 Tax=Acaryochloris marina TaxID=155978 RepID=UPI004059303F